MAAAAAGADAGVGPELLEGAGTPGDLFAHRAIGGLCTVADDHL